MRGQGDGGDKRAKAAEEVTCVPEEKGERDEAGGFKETRRGGWGLNRWDSLCEDWEDQHGYCKGHGDREGEIAEFEEEGEERDGFL